MSYDTHNHHLVAIDAGTKGRLVVAMPPRGSLTREQALMFAAWLITTADAADDPPRAFDARELVDGVKLVRQDFLDEPKEASTEHGAYRDTADGVTLCDATQFYSLSAARSMAAVLVALADGTNAFAMVSRGVFERIAAVHATVHDGSALDWALEQGEKIALKDPSRFRIQPASKTAPLADDSAPSFAEEADTAAPKKRQTP